MPAEGAFLGKCEFCGAVSQTESHWIRECPAPQFTTIRDKLAMDLNGVINKLQTNPTPARQFARAIRDLAYHHEDGHSVWTGLWRMSIINRICEEARRGPALSQDQIHDLCKVKLEIGRLFCYATSAIWNKRLTTPMTSYHCAELNSTYQDWAHYFVGVRPKLKQTRYRPLTAAQLKLRHTPMPPPPRLAGLTGQRRLDKIRNSVAPIERTRTLAMLALSADTTTDTSLNCHPPTVRPKHRSQHYLTRSSNMQTQKRKRKTVRIAAVNRLVNNAHNIRNLLTQHNPPPRGGEG